MKRFILFFLLLISLNAESAVNFYERLQIAGTIIFDNSTNDFTADNVQDAIEEAKNTAEGFPRAGIRAIANGVVGNDDWIGPNELMPDTPMVVFPVKTRINEITWSNDLDRTNRQFRIQFRSGSKTGTIFYTLTVTSTNPGYGYVDGLSFEFNPGTAIFAQYKDDGNNCSDFDLILWISRIP